MNKQEIGTYLNSITKENIVAAMLVLDNQEIPRSRQSDEYDVINAGTGKGYPPPYLIETAYKIATNNELPAGFFSNIGAKSPHFEFLKTLGFEIKAKNGEPEKKLEDYLIQLNNNQKQRKDGNSNKRKRKNAKTNSACRSNTWYMYRCY